MEIFKFLKDHPEKTSADPVRFTDLIQLTGEKPPAEEKPEPPTETEIAGVKYKLVNGKYEPA